MSTNEGDPPVTVDPRHVTFLRRVFTTAREALLDDLAQRPTWVSDPERDGTAAAQLGLWLAELAHGVLSASREELLTWQAVVDGWNDYERVVTEHEAFDHLLRQL